MPRPRFYKLTEVKRLHILETAAKEFAAHGFEHASFNRILDQAGVSKGAAYYYFDDKADLFFSTVQHYASSWINEITQIDPASLDRDTYWSVLMEVYRQPFTRFYETPWAFGVMRAVQHVPASVISGGGLTDYMTQLLTWLAAVINQGQAIGLVRTDLPNDLLFAIVNGFDQISDEWLLSHWTQVDRAELDRIMYKMADVLRRVISP